MLESSGMYKVQAWTNTQAPYKLSAYKFPSVKSRNAFKKIIILHIPREKNLFHKIFSIQKDICIFYV